MERRLAANTGHARGICRVLALAVAAAVPGQAGGDAGGLLCERIGIDIHLIAEGARLDLIRDSGMGWVRVDCNWFAFNPAPGVFDFATLDEVVATTTARGLKIYPSIGYTPAWATSGPFQTGVPDNVNDWTTAVTTLVTRYRDTIRHWGIWNEPNTTSFWTGTRQQFIDVIFKPAADAIHAADPNARVVGPELAHFVSAGRVYYQWLADIITQAGDKMDILSHHTYPRPLAADHSTITSQLNADTFFGDQPALWGFLGIHPSLREVIEELGWTGPVWLTEFGWRLTDLSEQQVADNYIGLFTDWLTGHPNRNWIDKFLLYHAESDEYGLFHADGSPRAAYFAIRDFIDEDDDDDGMPDAWELRYGLNPTNAADAAEDGDGDRQSNLAEFLADFNPTVSNAPFSIRRLEMNDGAVVSFDASTNRRYTLEADVGPGEPPWRPLPERTDVPGSGPGQQMNDPAPARKRDYRVSVGAP